MKNQDIIKLNDLRQQGKGAAEIAEMLNLPLNTVKSYLRRHCGQTPPVSARSAGNQ